MRNEEKIFLTPDEAVRAIAADLNYCEPRPEHVQEMFRILDDFMPTPGDPGYSTELRPEGNQKSEAPSPADELITLLKTCDISLGKLAELCGLVFWTLARAGMSPGGDCRGIWIRTMLENYRCRQCGQCCSQLNYREDITVDDCERWIRLGRYDILERVLLEKKGGEIVSARIWVKPGTDEFEDICPWLEDRGSGIQICTIHPIKPELCRQYPGTRKHAMLTGCNGLRDSEVVHSTIPKCAAGAG